MTVHPGSAFLTWGASLNFLPINIITDLGIEKWRKQLNKRLGKTPFLPLPQARLQPGHLFWCPSVHSFCYHHPAPSGSSDAQEGGLRASGYTGGGPQGLSTSFCRSFVLTHLLCSGGRPTWGPFLTTSEQRRHVPLRLVDTLGGMGQIVELAGTG